MNEVPSPRALRQSVEIPKEKPVIRALLAALDRERVSYCHWKSNCRLDDTLIGKEDIDILVERQDAAKFQKVMAETGFKLAVSGSGTEHPSTFHAIGLDEASAEVVDLHVCHQVYSGDSLVKNYRLAIEEELLADNQSLYGVRVPQPELELVYFVLRIALKHCSAIELLKSNRNYWKTSGELAWLRERADDRKATALCAQLFPAIEEDLFLALFDAIADKGALVQRIRLGRKVASRLRGLRRLTPARAMASRMWRFFSYIKGRITRRKDLSLMTGGLIVALVGPKASGKSTIAKELSKRLGKHLDVIRIHSGKPPSSILSFLPNLFLPLARKLLPHERLSNYETPERRERRSYSLFYVARMTLLAYDRRKLLRWALRQAAAGAIVLSDRYPSEVAGAIDSSCFDDVAISRCKPGLKRWLMLKERSFYVGLKKPDLVLKLEAPLDMALERDATRQKAGGPDAEAVKRRWQLENSSEFPRTPVVTLSTAAALDNTARRAVMAVWAAL